MEVKSVKDVRFLIHEYLSDSGTPEADEDKGFVEGLEWVDNILKELDDRPFLMKFKIGDRK